VHLDGLTTGSSSATTTALKVEAMRLVRESVQDASRAAIITSISAIACLATCALVCHPQCFPHPLLASRGP
jgi:hypothetical protein